jgi:hypothetical protein
MFEKLKRAVAQKMSEVKESTGLPPDLSNVPSVDGNDFGEVDLATLGTYVGRPVESVVPMGMLGPAATSFIGQRIQDRLREAASGGPEPGEMVPGQAAAREERMRAEGMSEEQIAMIRERIAGEVAARTANGWEVAFSQGHRATVQLVALDSEDALDFERLASRRARENGTDGHRPEDTAALSATVQRMSGAPYESYCLSGKLVAKGAGHVAIAQSGRVATPILAGLAAVALRTTESPRGQ